jgi:hypothetical protein
MEVFMADHHGSALDLIRASGKNVRLKGKKLGQNLVILDKAQVQVVAQGSATTGITGTTGILVAAPAIVGDQKTLAILVNFNNQTLACSAPDVANRIFGTTGATVNNNYKTSSQNLVSFSGKAVGPFTINYANNSCNYSAWGAAADAAAKASATIPLCTSASPTCCPAGHLRLGRVSMSTNRDGASA